MKNGFSERKDQNNLFQVSVSGILIYLLPAAFSGNAIWFAMPVTELLVSVYVIHEMIKYTKQLSVERKG